MRAASLVGCQPPITGGERTSKKLKSGVKLQIHACFALGKDPLFAEKDALSWRSKLFTQSVFDTYSFMWKKWKAALRCRHWAICKLARGIAPRENISENCHDAIHEGLSWENCGKGNLKFVCEWLFVKSSTGCPRKKVANLIRAFAKDLAWIRRK